MLEAQAVATKAGGEHDMDLDAGDVKQFAEAAEGFQRAKQAADQAAAGPEGEAARAASKDARKPLQERIASAAKRQRRG